MWDYASEGGTDWPVEPGDLWQVGDHLVLCGDPEAGSSELAAKLCGFAPTVACVDPPWGAGIHAGFRVKSGLGPYQDYDRLLYCVLRACAYASMVMVETGNRIVGDLTERAALAGLSPSRSWGITYGSKSPCALVGFVSDDIDPAWPDFEGLSDKQAWMLAFSALTEPGDLVLDPFCGVGRSAVAVARAQCLFVGAELQPARMSVCLCALAKAGAGDPELVERFPEVADSETYSCPP